MEPTATQRLKIKVLADGTAFIDDQPVDLPQIDQRLSELAKSHGVVWYHREAADAQPHPNADEIVRLIIKHRLPVSLSSKPDFSDWVDEKGVSHPRQ